MYEKKRALVWGVGVTGKGAIRLLLYLKTKVWVVNKSVSKALVEDLKEFEGSPYFMGLFGENEVQRIKGKFDFLVLSPGIDPRKKEIRYCVEELQIPLISEINLSQAYIDCPIIGITGTNGKTSTATYLCEGLKLAGKKAYLGGNIGIPLSELALKNLKSNQEADYIVLELSSFQLELVGELKPFVSMLLNCTFSHQERYEQFTDYLNAKLQIVKNQGEGDHFITTLEDQKLFKELDKRGVRVKQIDPVQSGGNLMGQFDFAGISLIGVHHFINFEFIYETFKILKLKDEFFQKLIDHVKPMEHRFETIWKGDNLFINDSKSTNFDSTCAALKSLELTLKEKMGNTTNRILILGGQIRGKGPKEADLDALWEFVEKCGIGEVLVYGEACKFLTPKGNTIFQTSIFDNLVKLMGYIKNQHESYSQAVVLFSPGHPSFDQYENYGARGRHFKKLVQELFS